MYLFDRTGDNIEIYTMTPNENWIKEYKADKMSQIPKSEQVLTIETNTKPLIDESSSSKKPADINVKDLNSSYGTLTGIKYHQMLGQIKTSESIKDSVDAYIEGERNNSPLARIYAINEQKMKLTFIRYLLLDATYTKRRLFGSKRTQIDVLNIPESLYLLELLSRGQFDLLDNKDISDQLALFAISDEPVKTYTMSDLAEMETYGFAKAPIDRALTNVRKSSSVFARIRKNNP